MNRRRLFIVLTLALPLALGGAAKWITHWRPVALIRVAPSRPGTVSFGSGIGVSANLRASAREVVDLSSRQLFDLQSEQLRALGKEGLSFDGAALWRVVPDSKLHFAIRRGAGPERPCTLPNARFAYIQGYPIELFGGLTRLYCNGSRVDLLIGNRLYRWTADARQQTRVLFGATGDTKWSGLALSRDGETVISAGDGHILARSTRTGLFTRRLAVPAWNGGPLVASTYGTYALYPRLTTQFVKWSVLSTLDARERWSFKTNTTEERVILAPDESRLAIARPARHIWEVRDLRSGAITQTLPLVPGAIAGAFSPDGATFYSVAEGVLYRQRAR